MHWQRGEALGDEGLTRRLIDFDLGEGGGVLAAQEDASQEDDFHDKIKGSGGRARAGVSRPPAPSKEHAGGSVSFPNVVLTYNEPTGTNWGRQSGPKLSRPTR